MQRQATTTTENEIKQSHFLFKISFNSFVPLLLILSGEFT